MKPKSMFVSISVLVILSLILSACSQTEQGVHDFETCAAAGNPVMESHPRQCTHKGRTFTELLDMLPEEPAKHADGICTDEQKKAEICTMEYAPVCGDDGKTYSNRCSACASGKIDTYESGECENKTEKKTGDDRDEHGCIGSAGYQWCESRKECVRTWETYCEEFKDQFREEITDYDDCVTAGFPVTEGTPDQGSVCVDNNGEKYVETV